MKSKKIVAVIAAALLSIGAMFALAACGTPAKDWSKASYDDYDPAVFMTKEGIKYGFCEDETSRQNVINDFGTPSAYLACYEDGSAAAIGCFYVPGLYKNMDEFNCGIQAFVDAQAVAFSWGYWTQEGNTVTIKVKGLWLVDYYKDGEPIPEMAFEDALAGEWTYEVEIENGSGSIVEYETIAMSSIAILPIHQHGAPAYKNLMAFATALDEKLNGSTAE